MQSIRGAGERGLDSVSAGSFWFCCFLLGKRVSVFCGDFLLAFALALAHYIPVECRRWWCGFICLRRADGGLN